VSAALIASDGSVLELNIGRWLDHRPAPEEVDVLQGVASPVLDVGCGPGRHVLALAQRGKVALGIDIAPHAIAIAKERGAPVLERSVFEHIPAAGRWRTGLLLDGNIGIGGDPAVLLSRIRELLAWSGTVVVEVEGPGVGVVPVTARIASGDELSPPFPWCRVGTDGIAEIADAAGYACLLTSQKAGRWFSTLA
jgi:SAM-dependent methyltransferase